MEKVACNMAREPGINLSLRYLKATPSPTPCLQKAWGGQTTWGGS